TPAKRRTGAGSGSQPPQEQPQPQPSPRACAFPAAIPAAARIRSTSTGSSTVSTCTLPWSGSSATCAPGSCGRSAALIADRRDRAAAGSDGDGAWLTAASLLVPGVAMVCSGGIGRLDPGQARGGPPA